MDAAVYARLSRNRYGLSDSVEIQTAEDRSYADEKLWPVVGTFSDDDVSASKYTTKPRPGYVQLVRAIERGEIEAIVCTEMTRLYRRLEELLELIKMAERTRLRAIWTTDDVGYDLSTPEGIHQAIGAVNNAMLESAKISKRVKRKKAASAKAGLPSGGGRPFGYEQDGLTLRASEVAVLQEGKDRYIAGETIRDIVRDLNKRGITTSEGKPWRIENFQRTLLKKRYIGIREHNETEYPAAWPAVFTDQEWQLMEARRASRAFATPHLKGVRSYLLTGFTYCGRCGTIMIGSRKQLTEGSVRRYRCRSMDNYGNKLGCGRMYRAADPVEALITEAVFYRFDTPEVAKALANTEDLDRTDELVKLYQEAKLNLDQMVKDYASGFLSRSQFGIAKTVAEDALQRAKDDLTKLQSRSTSGIPVGSEALREAWETGGIDWKRSVIQLLVERVVIHEGHPGSHKWKGWRFDPDLIEVTWRV